ncbi:hypothetical protein DFP72DRAFT_900187 [Ephemerocybe angulata]|uniref:SnoaL-like domain-containing protein n=1 Tax=Ephemerocybe angulata TaxID=980116 RepID=A0A8H6HVL8_9AGAR|nr:hypothetical protein DFP72DRAFT_900187 [Tulosesus angulatus]
MRFSALSLAALTLLASSVAATAVRPKCDPKARGPSLQQRQSAAIRDFAHIFLIEQDPKKAFDAYIPGTYIQHNPDALSGREPAIAFLTELWGTPSLKFSNVTAWAGEGYGLIHYRMRAPDADIHNAIMDRLRFEGTCFVEHWDVIQRINGNETNPLAFF